MATRTAQSRTRARGASPGGKSGTGGGGIAPVVPTDLTWGDGTNIAWGDGTQVQAAGT